MTISTRRTATVARLPSRRTSTRGLCLDSTSHPAFVAQLNAQVDFDLGAAAVGVDNPAVLLAVVFCRRDEGIVVGRGDG